MIEGSEAEGIAKVPTEGRLEAMGVCAVQSQSVQLPLAVQHQQECLHLVLHC